MSGDLSPEVPTLTLEQLPRKDFQYTTWEGFAVSLEEFDLIQKLTQDRRLRDQVVKLSETGLEMCDENGEIDISGQGLSQVLGTRVDGPMFFLRALLSGKYPPVKTMERVRNITEEEGILFASLCGYVLNDAGMITRVSNLAPGEIAKRMEEGKAYELDAALIDAIYPLLFQEMRSDYQFMTFVSCPLETGEDVMERDKLAFQYKGEALWDYLKLIAQQRSGIRWGVSRNIMNDDQYRFGKGHLPSREIEIQNKEGFISTKDMSFLITKPHTLERRIIEFCQKRPI